MKKVLGTVLSVLVVVAMVLFALILGFGNVNFGYPKYETAERDLSNLQLAMKRFHKEHRRYPSTEEGLQHLVDRHYLEMLPRDPWGNPYGYALQEGQPVLRSYGADGAPGGEGPDADISSRDPASTSEH
jgi:general secretion pathway protein G